MDGVVSSAAVKQGIYVGGQAPADRWDALAGKTIHTVNVTFPGITEMGSESDARRPHTMKPVRFSRLYKASPTFGGRDVVIHLMPSKDDGRMMPGNKESRGEYLKRSSAAWAHELARRGIAYIGFFAGMEFNAQDLIQLAKERLESVPQDGGTPVAVEEKAPGAMPAREFARTRVMYPRPGDEEMGGKA